MFEITFKFMEWMLRHKAQKINAHLVRGQLTLANSNDYTYNIFVEEIGYKVTE